MEKQENKYSDRTLVSLARTYQEIGEFWDVHDSTEYGGQSEVEFKVAIDARKGYYLVGKHQA